MYLVDIIGMGGSSRPKLKFKSSDEADEYLVMWLEQWRINVGLTEKFILAGHSFGGYVCGLYTSKHHQNIKKLLMLSSIGIQKFPEDFDFYKHVKFPDGRKPPKFLIDFVGR